MYVSVLNEAGAPVPDLGPSDFIVREDNVAREVLRVGPATEPLTLAILVDNSAAATNYVRDMRPALEAFVTTMTGPSEIRGKNEIAIIALADRPTILTDYTIEVPALMTGINRIFAQRNAGTLLLEAIIDTSKGFKKREAARPVILAITTEGPELSGRFYNFVLTPLYDCGAAFHAIIVGPPSGSITDSANQRGRVLDEGTRNTGGRRDNILTSMALKGKLAEVANELLHQYRITYAHPESLIPPESVTVTAAKPGMVARGTLIKERQAKP